MISATMHIDAIINATAGKTGYMGTLNGPSKSGSFFLKAKNDIMEMMYNPSAPKHEIVNISPVWPMAKAAKPISMLTNKAFAGVLNFLCTTPNHFGIFPTLPNSNTERPAASMIPLNDAINPNMLNPTIT